jgi:hypothetical protein
LAAISFADFGTVASLKITLKEAKGSEESSTM